MMHNNFKGIFEPTRIDADADRYFAECIGGPFAGGIAEIRGIHYCRRVRNPKGSPFNFSIAVYLWSKDLERGIYTAKFRGVLTNRQYNRWRRVSNRDPLPRNRLAEHAHS